MSQLQFLGGYLTRRPEILVTSQFPAEIVLCVIFDVIYFTRRINSVRHFVDERLRKNLEAISLERSAFLLFRIILFSINFFQHFDLSVGRML